jgi:transposase
VVITNGYKGYNGLKRAGPGRPESHIQIANCWAHARRKFVDCEKFYPIECGEAIDLIGKLYEVEAELPDPWTLPEPQREDAFDMLAELRDKKSRVRSRSGPKCNWRFRKVTSAKAVTYMMGHWPGLTLCLNNPRIPLDTNRTERGFRGPAVGLRLTVDPAPAQGTMSEFGFDRVADRCRNI